nr:lysosomal-trafficking regulator-like isoform X1 [Ciona intestinalis]XP_026692490.1 lysosomal-trafficking regulator-like isoform X1 [Ciona intestinalis]|eukprot:XP_009860308.2 lysosomal-trafficking regulator-like isoform X1 [Ciona intestinalis]
MSASQQNLSHTCDDEIIYAGDWASVQLLKRVGSQRNESLNENSSLVYLLQGDGSNFLRILLQLSRKGYVCSEQICDLCCSILVALVAIHPNDFSKHKGTLTFTYIDDITKYSDVTTPSSDHDIVAFYNNIRRQSAKKTSEGKGVKASWDKRKKKLRHLTGRWYEALSTDCDSSDGQSNDSSVKKLPLLSNMMSTENSDNFLFHPSTTPEPPKNDPSPSENKDPPPNLENQTTESSNKPFQGPFELATVLLDLLESSFCSMHQRSLHGKSPSRDGYSPMSVAMQLVSAITALQQTKGSLPADPCKYSSAENDKFMSQISYEDTRWTPESLSHLQRLVLRTVLVLCHVSLLEGQNLQEMMKNQAIESLMSVAQDILKEGGMVPHGTLPLRKKSLVTVATDANLSDQSIPCPETQQPPPTIPSVSVDEVPSFLNQFTTKNMNKNTGYTLNPPQEDSVIPVSLSFVAEIMKGLFSLLTSCLKQSMGPVSPKQLTEVIMLFHEFDACNGFSVFSKLLMRLNSISERLFPSTEPISRTLKTCTLSPVHSPTKTRPKQFGLSPKLPTAKQFFEKDNPVRILFNDLLGSFEKLITSVQKSKVEYVHRVTCSRRTHRSCDLHKLVPSHHDILGEESKLRMKVSRPNTNSDLQSKPQVIYPLKPDYSTTKHARTTSGRHEEPTCIIATCVQFLVNTLVNLSPNSSCVRHTLRTLDKVGVCQCQAVTLIVTPLLTHLECWSDKMQNAMLGYVGKILLYHFMGSKTTPNSENLSSFFINIPTAWLLKPISLSTDPLKLANKKGKNWRRSLPIDVSSSSESSASEISAEESFFLYNLSHPWLCLVMYRKLLASSDPDLSLKVALHLQTLSPHLPEESKMSLSSLVLLPILCSSSGIKYSLMRKELCSTGEVFREEILSIILCILLRYLESSDPCRAIFLRHGGLKAVNKILSHPKHSSQDADFSDHIRDLVFHLGRAYLTSVTILSPDVSVAVFSYYKKPPPLLKQHSTEPTSDNSVAGPMKTFLRGFSWGSEKFRTDAQERSTSLGSLRQKQENKSQINRDNQLTYTSTSIDELSVYYTELRKFVRVALALSGASTNDRAKEKAKKSKNFNFARALSGESTDSDPEFRSRPRTRNLSETSGYRSTSPESLNHSISNEIRSISSRSNNSTLSYISDSVSLPSDTDTFAWQQLVNYWQVLGLSVPMDNQISTSFVELNGFEVALKLLTMISTSLNEYYLSEMNFTFATQDNTAAGSVLDKSISSSSLESPTSNDNPLTAPKTPPKIFLAEEHSQEEEMPFSSSPKDVDLQEPSTLTHSHPTIDVSSVDDLPDVPDFGDAATDLKLVEMKLNLFCSCLRVCLFCSRRTDQFEIDVDDIISSLRPTLTGKLSSTYFGTQLFSSMFQAAISPVSETADVLPKLTTVLQGLQRVITSGGSTTRSRTSTCHSRSNSASIAINLMEEINNLDDDNDYDSESDDSTTGGYEGDSEHGLNKTPIAVPFKRWLDLPQTDGLRGFPNPSFMRNNLEFTPGPLLHPELLLLAVELLGSKADHQNRNHADSDLEILKEKFAANAEPLRSVDSDVRDCLIDSVGRALTRLAGFSKQNLDKMAKSDFASACIENLSDVLSSDKLHWKRHRDIIFSLCMTLTKHYMTSKHLRLILSLFNSSSPPLQELLTCLLDLVEQQEFGPNFCLTFSWKNVRMEEPTSGLPSDSESDSESLSLDEIVHTMSSQRSLTVWRVAPLHMQLENHIMWPPLDSGVTISLWLRVGMLNPHDCGCYTNSWTEGHVIMVESEERDQVSSQSSPYVHLVSIGSKQTMLQVWMENSTLIFRVCVDPNDEKPVGVLAQTECANFLQPNQWQHLTMTYTESRMPDKAILGKVHLILDCFIETDVILEFNLPQVATKSGLSSWRQTNPNPQLAMQKATFFLGHYDKLHVNYTKSDDITMTSSTISVGNIMIFNLATFSCQSAFAIEQLGSDACCFTDCLTDSLKTNPSIDSRIRFVNSDANPKITPERGVTPSPRLFKLLPQTFNSDLINDEVITGEIRPDFKTLQDALVLTYTPCEPMIFHRHSVAAPATPTKKRKLFRRATPDSLNLTPDPSPLVHSSEKVKVRKPHKEHIVPNVYSGLNRALSQVGGIHVFLLLYPKVIEITSSLSHLSSDAREELQVLALRSLLHLRASDTKRRREFLTSGVSSMLQKVMTKSDCVVGFRTLEELMNSVCSETVIQSYASVNNKVEFQINLENSGLIHDHELLTTFILDWKIWHKAKNLEGEEDFSVWTLLLQSLESLIRDDHIYQWFNIKALLRAKMVEKLLNNIQEMLNADVTPFHPHNLSFLWFR